MPCPRPSPKIRAPRPLGIESAIATGLLALGLLTLGPALPRAAGGLAATDVAVVVNGGSLNSRTLANHYVALRQIPAINVIVLDDVPNSEVIPVEEFRARILHPLLTTLEQRRLAGHIQCIAYSADFPTAIDISGDLQAVPHLHQVFTKTASINALTYLYARVLRPDPTYIDLNANAYARRGIASYFANPAGAATEQDWNRIQKQIENGEHAEASAGLETLYGKHPHQFPLAYLAAAEAALAGDRPRAVEWLQTAIANGWSAAHFLANDERFDSLRDDPDFQVLEYLLDDDIRELQPAIGFDARTAWTPNGVPVQDASLGFRYLLSTVLGVTRGPGTSLPEAIEILQRAAAADSSHPQGGFYFSLTSDVRTTTRQWGALAAVDDLRRMGFEAEIVSTALPMNKPRVLGAQIGTPTFQWETSASQIVPGAIVENLTSLGGVMVGTPSQTNLSELLLAGAAGSSGTVTEPYALQEKFPHPQLYVHYARGASLAEAFYLSVTGPYQLLIVGDPLARPFSNAPEPKVDTAPRFLDDGDAIEVALELDGPNYVDWLQSSVQQSERSEPLAPASIEVLFDGGNLQKGAIQSRLRVRVAGQTPGYHEVHLRFAADDPLRQRSDRMLPVWIGPRDAVRIELHGDDAAGDDAARDKPTGDEAPSQSNDAAGDPPSVSLQAGECIVQVHAESGERITLWHDHEQIAEAEGREARFTVSLARLGMGPVRLQARVARDDDTTVASQPLWITVTP